MWCSADSVDVEPRRVEAAFGRNLEVVVGELLCLPEVVYPGTTLLEGLVCHSLQVGD